MQVRDGDTWTDVPPLPGSFICNIGDMLEKATGGVYRSTPQRVQNTSSRYRVSMPFFFDPGCPFAWQTSVWIRRVAELRDVAVGWRFISLKVLNEARIGTDAGYDESWQASHYAGLYAHRVCDEVRQRFDNAAVGRLYTVLGEAFHKGQRRPEINADPVGFMKEMLSTAGLPVES